MVHDTLRTALLELARAAAASELRVFLGGGYGLYLKQVYLAQSGIRTLIPVEAWPRPRATADLDLFLSTEIIVDLESM